MLILLTIFLLILVPLAMVLINLVRPRFSIQGFLAVITALAGWIMVMLARGEIPQTVTLLIWKPESFFPNSPTLLLDEIAWYFAVALMSLTLGLIIASIAQLGQSTQSPALTTPRVEVIEVQGLPNPPTKPVVRVQAESIGHNANWRSWGGMLMLTSLGLVGVTAGNLLTLLLAWAAVDIIELVILMGQVQESNKRERIVLGFSARMAGIALVLLAGTSAWSQGISLSYDAVSQSTSLYLILAAGLRLGVVPIHLPLIQQIPLRRALGTVLRLVPVATSFILLVRVASTGFLGQASVVLLVFIALAGLYAAVLWLNATDELDGRPYWLLGTAALAMASAIMRQPLACLAWSLAGILSGGLVFSMSMRHKNLPALAILGMINFSALPFSPTWMGTRLYQYSTAISTIVPPAVFYMLSFVFILVHAFLLAGIIRHILRGIYPVDEGPIDHIERWVWFIFPTGLVFISVTHLLSGLLFMPDISEIALPGWTLGFLTVTLSALILFLYYRFSQRFPHIQQSVNATRINSILSLEWLYRILWQIYRFMMRLISMLSTILEGDGGILWALVLFALIFVFLQR
jgi:hypothetical protein